MKVNMSTTKLNESLIKLNNVLKNLSVLWRKQIMSRKDNLFVYE